MTGSVLIHTAVAGAGTVATVRLDPDDGSVTLVRSTPTGPKCGVLVLDEARCLLHAVVKTEPYRIVTLRLDEDGIPGEVAATTELPAAPAYLSMHPDGQRLFGVSYEGCLLIVVDLADDGLPLPGRVAALATHRLPHAALTSPDGQHLYVPCLQDDLIEVYDVRDGALTPLPTVPTQPHGGPRHLAFSGDGRLLYVVEEMSGSVYRYSRDVETGALSPIDSILCVDPADGLTLGHAHIPGEPLDYDTSTVIWAADLQLSADGRLLIASERTRSKIAVVDLDEWGDFIGVRQYLRTQDQPRAIAFADGGRVIIGTGERSPYLVAYRADSEGQYAETGRVEIGRGTTWVAATH